MGCDIHCFAEVLENGVWKKVGSVFNNPYYEPERNAKWNVPFIDAAYSIRNYAVFSILAGVRTDNHILPIAYPRGIPSNASKKIRDIVDKWSSDGHSHSFFILHELLGFDWHGQEATHISIITEQDYLLFRENGFTNNMMFYSAISGYKAKTVTDWEYEQIIKNPTLREDYHYSVAIQWKKTYYESARQFVDETIPALQKLGDPDKVRIVFFFDN